LDTTEWIETRKHPRSKGSWPVVIITDRGALIAETRNISPLGAFIFCDRPLPVQEKIRVLIMFPNQRYLDIPAEVTWSYPYGSYKDDPPCGMGVGPGFHFFLVFGLPEIRTRKRCFHRLVSSPLSFPHLPFRISHITLS